MSGTGTTGTPHTCPNGQQRANGKSATDVNSDIAYRIQRCHYVLRHTPKANGQWPGLCPIMRWPFSAAVPPGETPRKAAVETDLVFQSSMVSMGLGLSNVMFQTEIGESRRHRHQCRIMDTLVALYICAIC